MNRLNEQELKELNLIESEKKNFFSIWNISFILHLFSIQTNAYTHTLQTSVDQREYYFFFIKRNDDDDDPLYRTI